MAIRALAIGGHVIGRLERGKYDTALRMAARAFRGGFSKGAADMAAFAGHADVGAVEHESGAEVIES